MVAVALIGGAVIGGAASAYAGNKAASAQKSAANSAAQTSSQQYQQTRGDLAPYRNFGSSSQNELSALYGFNGPEAQQAAMGRFRTDPGYQFQRDEAINAVQGSAAARGSLFSGGTLRAISDRTQNLFATQYGDYLNRLQAGQGVGQNSAAQTGTFGAQSANNIANAQLAAGNATAGAYQNMGNSISNGLNQAAGIYGAYKGGAFGGGYGAGFSPVYGSAAPYAQSILGRA